MDSIVVTDFRPMAAEMKLRNFSISFNQECVALGFAVRIRKVTFLFFVQSLFLLHYQKVTLVCQLAAFAQQWHDDMECTPWQGFGVSSAEWPTLSCNYRDKGTIQCSCWRMGCVGQHDRA